MFPVYIYVLPSRSSPKLPQPIFFPTRKLGPTMRTFLSLISLWGADDVSGPIFGLCPNTWTGSL